MEVKKKLVGEVTHYYTRIGVAVVRLIDELTIGDEILIEGKTTNFRQRVESMQIEKRPIQRAKAGQIIGLKVVNRVREKDSVYKIIDN